MTQINEKELQFVVTHYKEGIMDEDAAWQRLKKRTGKSSSTPLRKYAVAASVVLAVGMALACGVWMSGNMPWISNKGTQQSASVSSQNADSAHTENQGTAKVFYYDKTPINSVLADLASYYSVAFTASDTTKCVSGEIEASELADVIDLLETSLKIKIDKK